MMVLLPGLATYFLTLDIMQLTASTGTDETNFLAGLHTQADAFKDLEATTCRLSLFYSTHLEIGSKGVCKMDVGEFDGAADFFEHRAAIGIGIDVGSVVDYNLSFDEYS